MSIPSPRCFVLPAILGLCLAAGASAQAPPTIDWSPSYSLALEEALLTRRPIFVTFTASWCGWCRKLEATTLRDPSVMEILDHWVTVRVDGDKEKGLAALYRVTGYPTTILLTRRGEEIARIPGYQPPDAFRRALEAGLARRENLAQAQAQAAAEPKNPEAQYALGDVLLAMGSYPEALQAFARVETLDQDMSHDLADDARLEAGMAHLFAGEYAPAVEAFQAFLARYPEHERGDEVVFFMGLALVGAGSKDEGKKRIEEAATMTQLEYIRYEAGRLEERLR